MGYTKLGNMGMQKVGFIRWEKNAARFLHLDLLLFDFVSFSLSFAFECCRLSTRTCWLARLVVACYIAVFYMPSEIFFSRVEDGSTRLDVHGLDLEDLESLSRNEDEPYTHRLDMEIFCR